VRGHNLAALGRLLDQGVKVALVYGDSDYQCNCEYPVICCGSVLTNIQGLEASK